MAKSMLAMDSTLRRWGAVSALLPLVAVLSRESVVRRLLIQFVILALRGATPAAVGFLIRNIWMNASPHHFHPRVLVKYGLISWCLAETIFMIYIWQYTRFLNGQTTRRWRAVNVHNTAEKRRASMERYLLAIQQVAHGGDQAESRPKNTFQKAATNHFATPGLKGNNGLRLSSSTASLKRTASFLMGVVKQEESVEDLLKHMEGSSGNLEAELQRLRWHELATFFHGPGRGDADEITEWLQRDNVKDWIAHYWFRGATPEELMEDNPQQFQELRALVDLVLQTAGLQNLPQGRNPKLIAHRVSSDPLPVVHRPLMVYAGTSLLCPMVSYKVMQWLGFHRERAGGLCYWKRSRQNVAGNLDLAAPRQVPLVFIHGLGVGLVPYFLFIYRLTQRHSGDLFVPEFPFLAMAPWESVPSAREVVSQLQDMLAAHGHTSAQWAGHSFGCVVIGWVMKMSPSSMRYATLMEPAQFLIIKAEALTKILWGRPGTTFEILIRYFAFRELFTVNLLCRNFFWEQSSMWPEDLKVPSIIALAGDDHIVQSTFVRRLLEHEKSARRLKKRMAAKKTRLPTSGSSTDVRVDTLNLTSTTSSGPEPLEILWNEGFFHGQILCDRRAQDRLFLRMKSMVREESEG